MNAFQINIFANGTIDPLVGAKGSVRNRITNTALELSETQEDGKLSYTVNDGTYFLWIQLWGYQFNNPYTLSISDNIPVPMIIYGTKFNPVSNYPDCCTIYGQLVDFKLEDEQDIAVVIHADVLPQFIEDVLLTNQSYTVFSDVNGNFEFYAIKGSQINVRIEVSGIDTLITVPTLDTCPLITLL